MAETTLEVYTFHLHKTREKNNRFDFKNVLGQNIYEEFKTNFIAFIDKLEFKDIMPDSQNNTIERRAIFIPAGDNKYSNYFEVDEKRNAIYGIVKSGLYGKPADVFDITSQEVVLKGNKMHAPTRPFFFLICFSPKKKEGFLMLERIGNEGIGGIFKIIFSSFLASSDLNITLKMSKFIDDKVIEKFIKNGEYSKIILSRKSISPHAAKRYNISEYLSKDFKLELSITSRKKGVFGSTGAKKDAIKYFENNPNGFFTQEVFNELGFDESTDVKVVSTYGGKKRIIDLRDTFKAKPYYIVDVSLNSDGYSDFYSIKEEAIDFLDGLNENLKLYDV